jgi:predicted nucleic acid-binding Zn ribbon protein
VPIHRYLCTTCGKQRKFLVQGEPIAEKPCSCGQVMVRQLGTPDSIPMESTDEYRGNSRFQDTERKRKERADRMDGLKLKKSIERNGTAEAKIRGKIHDRDLPK